MKRTVLALLIIASAACEVGPLPPTPPPNATAADVRRRDGFPTNSTEDPFPLDIAIRTSRLDEVRRLLESGANPNLRWGQSGDHFPLQEALDTGGTHQLDPRVLVPLLLKYGADPNARWCPFESRGENGFGPACTSARATTALHFAAMYDNVELVAQLLAAGADPTPRDWANASALDFAYNEIVFETIARALFPDVDSRDRLSLSWLNEYDGRWFGANAWESTPLSRALGQTDSGFVPPPPLPPPPAKPVVSTGDPTVAAWAYQFEREGRVLGRVRTLLRIGANPNERATTGGADWTPIGMAMHQRALRVARLLLEHGANPNERSCVRIVSGSFSARWPDGRPVFYRHPNCTLENGTTPLLERAHAGDLKGVALLLEFKADRSLKDWAGRTALDYANNAEIKDLISGLSGTGISKH